MKLQFRALVCIALWAIVYLSIALVEQKAPYLQLKGFGAVAIIMVSIISPLFQTILNKAFFKFLGKISFTLYLSHFFILQSSGVFLMNYFKMNEIKHFILLTAVIMLPLVVAFAFILHKLIDAPSMQFTHDLNAFLKKSS